MFIQDIRENEDDSRPDRPSTLKTYTESEKIGNLIPSDSLDYLTELTRLNKKKLGCTLYFLARFLR